MINLLTGEVRELGSGAFAAYSPSGHIVYDRGIVQPAGIWALPVSRNITPTGPAFPLASAGTMPSVSNDGTLVYAEGERNLQLVFRDRSGKQIADASQPQAGITTIAISPDGKKVAVNSVEQGGMDIWIHQLDRPLKSRVTFLPGAEVFPKWSPEGRQIAFRSNSDIFAMAADGTGEPALLIKSPQVKSPGDWSADGKYLIYTVTGSPKTGTSDLWYLAKSADGRQYDPVPFLETRFEESSPRIAPNGKFVAYISNQSGTFELYVRPFPTGLGQWQVSTGGALQPRWGRDSKELFYIHGPDLTVVPVVTEETFSFGSPKRLLSLGSRLQDRNSLKYDIMPDGRILVLEPVEGQGEKAGAIHIVENWPAAFRPAERKH